MSAPAPSTASTSGAIHPARKQRAMTQPINQIFRFLQSKQLITVHLYENAHMIMRGKIIGFDEFMNLVLDEAEEIEVKHGKKDKETAGEKAEPVKLGRILLKGDSITAITQH